MKTLVKISVDSAKGHIKELRGFIREAEDCLVKFDELIEEKRKQLPRRSWIDRILKRPPQRVHGETFDSVFLSYIENNHDKLYELETCVVRSEDGFIYVEPQLLASASIEKSAQYVFRALRANELEIAGNKG